LIGSAGDTELVDAAVIVTLGAERLVECGGVEIDLGRRRGWGSRG